MHETVIAGSILDLAAEKLKITPGAEKVAAIEIIVGEFRNVDLESLQFAFENMRDSYKGCDNTILRASSVQTIAECRRGHKFNPSLDGAYSCDNCGEGIGKILTGEELDIVRILLEANKE